MPKRRRRLSTVLGELEFEDNPTRKDDIRPCRYCGRGLPHFLDGGKPMPIKHDAFCGLPCLGGGVDAGSNFHSDRCPICWVP